MNQATHPLEVEYRLLYQRIGQLQTRKADDAEIKVLTKRFHHVWQANMDRIKKIAR